MRNGLADFSVDDLAIDSDGRLILTNPQLAGMQEAAARLERDKPKAPETPNTNCHGCNTVPKCGATTNNNIKGCGSTLHQ